MALNLGTHLLLLALVADGLRLGCGWFDLLDWRLNPVHLVELVLDLVDSPLSFLVF